MKEVKRTIKIQQVVRLHEFSEVFLRDLTNFGQNLYEEYLIHNKTEFLKEYSRKLVPTKELEYFKKYKALDYQEFLYEFKIIDREVVELQIKIYPAKLKELLNKLQLFCKKKDKRLLRDITIKTAPHEYKLQLTKENHLIVNDCLVTKLTSMENIATLKCCIKNPNQKITKDKIKRETQHVVSRAFHGIIDNYRFTPEMRQIFFPEIDKNYIIFHNPGSSPVPLKISKHKFSKKLKSSK